MSNQTIYVELDALMDTRLATLSRLIGTGRAVALYDKGYPERETDDFNAMDSIVDNTQYVNTYKWRDLETLANSSLTNLILVLKDVIQKTTMGTLGAPMADVPEVVINTYPYKLSDVQQGAVKDALQFHIGNVQVNTLFVSPLHLTPAYITGTYQVLFMYDFLDWFDMHKENLEKNPMPETTFFVPKIGRYGEVVEQMKKAVETDIETRSVAAKTNLYDATTLALVSHLSLQFLPVSAFCMLVPDQSDVSSES